MKHSKKAVSHSKRHKKSATRHGIIVLLDALGTRTATIQQARTYLSALAVLQRNIRGSLEVNLSDHPKETLEFYNKLSVHFFGDSVLMIYDTAAEKHLRTYVRYLCETLIFLYLAALENQILFRGAISIGEYIQEENVVLGPAVTDAAAWYDKFDFIGTAATPFATQQIRQAYYEHTNAHEEPWTLDSLLMLLYPVPLNNGRVENLFAVNWPSSLGYKLGGPPSERKFLRLYYALINRYPVPFGTERKFANTEEFVKVGGAAWTADD